MVAYIYAADRKSERAEAHLKDFAGILQVDGYGGYAALARPRNDVRLAFCWAHVRRKFYELADKSPVAAEILRRIALLYAIENDVRGLSADERRLVRNERSRPIVDDLRSYLEECKRLLSAKSKLAEAIRYPLTRCDGLSHFLEDGRVDLNSNTVERSIRPLALNRKNALFAGSDEGGDNWAVIATLVENCKLSGINQSTSVVDADAIPTRQRLSGEPHRRAHALDCLGLRTPLTSNPLRASSSSDNERMRFIVRHVSSDRVMTWLRLESDPPKLGETVDPGFAAEPAVP
jgi:hypothetical protein